MSVNLDLARWKEPSRVASSVGGACGFLLPIQVVHGTPSWVLSLASYMGFAAVWTLFPIRTSALGDRQITCWLVPLGLVAFLLAPVSALRQDQQMLQLAGNFGLSIAAAWILVRRPGSVRPLLAGFVAGATLSAMTVVMQAADLPAFAPDHPSDRRQPGLAGSSLQASWHFAIAIVCAIFLAVTARGSRGTRALVTVSIGICLAGLVLCGSQGGIVGLAVAGLLLATRTGRPQNPSRIVIAVGGASLILAMLVFLAAHLGAPSFDELGGAGLDGFENEQARIELTRHASASIIEHPVTGRSMEAFRDEHGLAPHLFPLTIGVVLGVGGVILAAVPLMMLVLALVRGPKRRDASARLGLALLGVFVVYALVEPVGPFVSVSRLPLLVVAALACSGLVKIERLDDRPLASHGQQLATPPGDYGASDEASPL